MTNAPERIYAFRNLEYRSDYFGYSHILKAGRDSDAEYIRLDLHQEALIQAHEEGFTAGRESVLSGDDSE